MSTLESYGLVSVINTLYIISSIITIGNVLVKA